MATISLIFLRINLPNIRYCITVRPDIVVPPHSSLTTPMNT